jgi:anti-anti-sigma factor
MRCAHPNWRKPAIASRVRGIRGAPLLSIEQTSDAGAVTLTLRGELDSATATQLDEAITSAMSDARTGIVVRIATLDFIGGAGLRSLEHAQQRARAKGLSFVVVANAWQLKIASVLGDMKLTIRLVEGPQGWRMRAPATVAELGVLAA